MAKFVALQSISHGGALAYGVGDPVHEDNVDRNGYVVGEQVAEVDSDEGRAVLDQLAGRTSETAEPAEDDDEPGDEAPDLAASSVGAVNAWLDGHPEAVDRVLAAERVGKQRAGILHGPHGSPPDVAEV